MHKSTTVGRIFGIDVKLHYSWWFIFALLMWSLSVSYFPLFYPKLSTSTYWIMGITSAILLFISVLLHELSHSLVARLRNINVDSITLFFFGGVAGITDEDMNPTSEFVMAIAGPLFSFVLAGLFFAIHIFSSNMILTAITFYLYQLNLILAIFNLIPGFPLDGGRAFRALLYAYYKDLKKATKIAAWGGRLFAIVLMGLGLYGILTSSGGGLWFILIGGFLYFIAGVSYDQVVLKEILSKVKVKDLLKTRYTTISPSTKLSSFVKNYANSEQELFVVKSAKFQGILDLDRAATLAPKNHPATTVKQLTLPISELPSLKVTDNVYTAFKLIMKDNLLALPVMKGKVLQGIITKRSIVHRLVWETKFNTKNSRRYKKL